MLVFLMFVLILLAYLYIRSTKRPFNFPPGPRFMPYTGNTLQLRKEAQLSGGQHLAYENLAKKYNTNVLGLRLRNELVVVVFSYTLVQEVQIEEVFEGRPDNFFLRLRTMGTRKGITCTDGQLWYDHRNWAMRQLKNLGYGRSEMHTHIEEEAKSLIEFIDAANESPLWPGSFLARSVINVIWTLTAGKRFEHDDKRLKHLLDLLNKRSKVFDMSGGLLTQFPWLRYIMPERTGYALIQKLNQEFYQFFIESIQEHNLSLLSNNNFESDLIYAYLSEIKNRRRNGESDSTFNETQLIMTILDLFIAGSQTTSNTLDLALMMLALHVDIQDKIFKEIVNNRKDNSSHVNSRLSHPYTNAFLMEVQRFFHIVPISGPRRVLRDTKLGGYDIPRHTTILLSLRSVHMDKNHWGDPENFRPERFLDEVGKLRFDAYFMPFGLGRRRCLGDSLAKACLFTFVVELVYKYQIECYDEKPSTVLQPGITLSPKPYKVRFLKRSVNT